MKTRFSLKLRTVKALAVFLFVIGPAIARADFTIVVNYTTAVTASQQTAFQNAANEWASLISGYQNGVVVASSSGSSYNFGDTMNTLFIDAAIQGIDGVGGILGSAGPNEIALDNLGFTLATDGAMTFDSADVANLESNGTFEQVILHEMGHVMGFGTLWGNNGVYVDGTGEFTGANATAEWQSEFGQIGNPDVELEGGGGTADGHWNENMNGSGTVGITDSMDRDMRDELMTGWLNPNSFISDLTIASFVDIGYAAAVVPEPATLGGLGVFMLGWLGTRRRRRV